MTDFVPYSNIDQSYLGSPASFLVSWFPGFWKPQNSRKPRKTGNLFAKLLMWPKFSVLALTACCELSLNLVLRFCSSDRTLCHIQSLLISGFSHKQETKFLFFISSINAGPRRASRLIVEIIIMITLFSRLTRPLMINEHYQRHGLQHSPQVHIIKIDDNSKLFKSFSTKFINGSDPIDGRDSPWFTDFDLSVFLKKLTVGQSTSRNAMGDITLSFVSVHFA